MTLKCTEMYLVIKPLDNWKNISRRLEICLSDVSVWMRSTMLKLNQDKSELIVFSPKHRVKEFSECYLSFDGTIVTDASFVKNLGIFFDRTLFIQKQASVITKSCYFQIRNFGRIRSYTTEDTCKTLKETNAYKYLGVYFSRSISFSYHIKCYLKENFEKSLIL